MSARDFLHAAFHDSRTHAYRVVESTVWTLIILSIGVLVAEPFFSDGSRGDQILQQIDRVVLWLFAIEVSTRILTFRPPELQVFKKPPLGRLRTEVSARVRFALTPMMLIDILTVLALVPALRGLRALRLLRLLRTQKLFRYANPFRGLMGAFEEDRLLFTFAFAVLGVETILGGISLFLVERAANPELNTLGDGLWWALVTITTVGFGDITPVTTVGRFIGGTMMVGGLFTLALFAGIVSHSLLHAVLSIREEQFRMSGYVNHIVVCGYEMGSGMLLDVLSAEISLDQQRVILFGPYERPRELRPEFMWVQGDPTKESELDKARITHASTVIVTGSSALTKSPVTKNRKKPVRIIAEVLDSENVQHARAAGSDEVVETRRVGYSLLAHTVVYPGVADATSRLVFGGHQNLYVGLLPEGTEAPMTFDQLSREVRASTGCLVIGFRNPETGEERINPASDALVMPEVELLRNGSRCWCGPARASIASVMGCVAVTFTPSVR
ncbi:MAG: ion transporter [Deltaproteobacteria bacterium]|nr:ion transporter [Deltaproteobacteria bacterium]